MSLPHQLPGPNADFWDWQLHSKCRGEASEIFYHPDGERGRARTQRENRACKSAQRPAYTQQRSRNARSS